MWARRTSSLSLVKTIRSFFCSFVRLIPSAFKSEIVIDIESDSADLNADGIRRTKLQKNDRVLLTSDKEDVLLAHIKPAAFADRLVAKFKLPVEGWRGE